MVFQRCPCAMPCSTSANDQVAMTTRPGHDIVNASPVNGSVASIWRVSMPTSISARVTSPEPQQKSRIRPGGVKSSGHRSTACWTVADTAAAWGLRYVAP